MRLNRLRAPSPALVVSLIALVIALGGTSYAAFALPRNSVGSKQIANGAITTKKIKNRAVTASKLNTAGLTVPDALHAAQAGAATTASHASTADTATTATTAIDANTLGGNPPSTFETAANLKTADVTNDGTTATVVRGNAGAAADRVGAGQVDIFFPVNVAGCTWLATQSGFPAGFASIESATGNRVRVLTSNASGTLADANFQLLVVC
jgi:hypothetical protein